MKRTEDGYEKKIHDLAKKFKSRDDLHDAYKEKMKDILFQFSTALAYMEEDFDPKKISIKRIKEFISQWVELHFNKDI